MQGLAMRRSRLQALPTIPSQLVDNGYALMLLLTALFVNTVVKTVIAYVNHLQSIDTIANLQRSPTFL